MNAAAQSVSGLPVRLWTWWTGELSAMRPRIRTRPVSASAGLVVTVRGNELQLTDERPRRGKRTPLPQIVGDDVPEVLLVAARERPPVPVRLRLPHAACFIRRVEVPAGLRNDIKRFLDIDLERVTPFRLKDVYTAHVIEPQAAKPGMLAVQHIIVRREAVDKPMADIERTGIKVSAVDIWNPSETGALAIDLLPKPDDGTGQAKPHSSSGRLMLIAAALLAALALYQDYNRHDQALAELSADTEAARAKALSVQQRLESSEGSLKAIRALEALRANSRPAAEVLDALTRLLPDTVWVTDLRLDGATVQITGEAAEAAPLITLIERSPDFSDAAFQASVTRDATDAKERFTLRARIGKEPPHAVEPTAEAMP